MNRGRTPQNKAQPQTKKTPPRQTPSPAQIEARRRAAAKKAAMQAKIKEENKKRRAFLFKLFLYRFAVYLVVLALMLSVTAIVFFIGLKKVDKIDNRDFTYILADEKKKTLSYEQVVRDGIIYINFSEIAEKFGLAITGSYDSVRFVSSDKNEYVRLFPESKTADINKNEIYLSGAPILDGKDVWIPLDFITRYIDGISVKYDEGERTVTVKRVSYGAADKAVTFTHKYAGPIKNISESEDYGYIDATGSQ